jgi:hypothetical protein
MSPQARLALSWIEESVILTQVAGFGKRCKALRDKADEMIGRDTQSQANRSPLDNHKSNCYSALIKRFDDVVRSVGFSVPGCSSVAHPAWWATTLAPPNRPGFSH